jgi:histidinol-phosphate/aromatic aminotransferase/cobyric acid decarboxylase-like protein
VSRKETLQMTDEERQKLCAELRLHMEYYGMEFCEEAADEIGRLAAENEQLKDKLIKHVAESNAEFFFASFPEKRADWMKDD